MTQVQKVKASIFASEMELSLLTIVWRKCVTRLVVNSLFASPEKLNYKTNILAAVLVERLFLLYHFDYHKHWQRWTATCHRLK